jgi:hypothetical protein
LQRNLNFSRESRLQRVSQHALPSVTLGFISGQLGSRKWRTRCAFSAGRLSDGRQMQGQMECCRVRRLPLDGEEICSWHSVQATS